MRKRSPYRPQPAAVNTVEMAKTRARKLDATDVHQQMALVRQALADFTQGQHCAAHWRSLADTANMAETLASMRLGGGLYADGVIQDAQQVLADVHQRQAERGTWTLYADEIDALRWLLSLHAVQLEACSYGEFERAYRRTANRIEQARAGNAAAGAIVIVGDVHGEAAQAA